MVEHRAEVVVPAPRAQVFELWSHLTDFPTYMHFVEEVLPLVDGRTHWVANIVGRHDWVAVPEGVIEGQQLGWRSVEGLANSGRVTFEEVAPGATRVRVQIAYDPPLGAVGALGDALGAGKAFERALQQDLEHFAAMVAAAPPGASDPHASTYIYNPESAVAEGRTREQWKGLEIPREFEW